MKFEILNCSEKGFYWIMKTNNDIRLAGSRIYTKKSDCLRAIEKHFNCQIFNCGVKFGTDKKITRAFRDGIKLFAEIIDKTK